MSRTEPLFGRAGAAPGTVPRRPVAEVPGRQHLTPFCVAIMPDHRSPVGLRPQGDGWEGLLRKELLGCCRRGFQESFLSSLQLVFVAPLGLEEAKERGGHCLGGQESPWRRCLWSVSVLFSFLTFVMNAGTATLCTLYLIRPGGWKGWCQLSSLPAARTLGKGRPGHKGTSSPGSALSGLPLPPRLPWGRLCPARRLPWRLLGPQGQGRASSGEVKTSVPF